MENKNRLKIQKKHCKSEIAMFYYGQRGDKKLTH
jgi:hypothetical protein